MGMYGRQLLIDGDRKFVIEPISTHANRNADWNNGLKQSDMPKGGAVHPDDSLITEENGFKNIVVLGPGESLYSAIADILKKDK